MGGEGRFWVLGRDFGGVGGNGDVLLGVLEMLWVLWGSGVLGM